MVFRFIYEGIIRLYSAAVHLASLNNAKAKAFVQGRNNFPELARAVREQAGSKRLCWFHCSSLGEYEQARPVIEGFMAVDKDAFVLLTFFSPSGYEFVRKKNPAHALLYLPVDTASAATSFMDILSPSLAVFVKYDFWYNYLRVLNKRRIPIVYFSVSIREGHFLTGLFGKPLRKELRQAARLFVQDAASEKRLMDAGFTNVEVAGDTRIDRVVQVAAAPLLPDEVRNWSKGKKILVLGSLWQHDLDKISGDLQNILNDKPDTAIVWVAHEPTENGCTEVQKLFPEHSCSIFTAPEPGTRILYVNAMGYLSSIYSIGCMAYVGGGFGKGIHNILEAAVYGIPVMFGPEHHKFNEAKNLLDAGTAFVFREKGDLHRVFIQSVGDTAFANKIKNACRNYFSLHAGASKKIVNFIQTIHAKGL